MKGEEPPPDWQLPAGVNASLWRYAHSIAIAEDEERYFAAHPLFRADRLAVLERFQTPGLVADLGCGAGRMTLEMARQGFAVVGVELSRPMLQVLDRKARSEGLVVAPLQANLCRLGCLPPGTFDYALSLFSTLGMIRGASARATALREVARILRPGGRLALHAHNIWLNATSAEGSRWLWQQFAKGVRGEPDAGDRRMLYRGIPGMEVHLYRWPELRRALEGAGFRIDEVLPIDTVTAEPLRWPWLLRNLRAGGWMVFASKL